MIEGGFGDTAMGKMILAACFITDFGTVLALGGLFADFNGWLLAFVIIMCVVLWFMPAWTTSIIDKFGATRVSEPEVKFIFFVLFFLGGFANAAKSEAVLPAYLVGLVLAGVFLRDKTLVHRMRSIAFAIFTPFYFIKAGLYVSLPALWPAFLIVGGLLLLKMLTKTIGLAACAFALHESARSRIHNTADGDRSYLRHHFGAVWFSEQDYRSAPVHDFSHGRDLERIRPDPFRAETFSTNQGRDARVGSPLSASAGCAIGGGSRRNSKGLTSS
jgi:hypothetical protein